MDKPTPILSQYDIMFMDLKNCMDKALKAYVQAAIDLYGENAAKILKCDPTQLEALRTAKPEGLPEDSGLPHMDVPAIDQAPPVISLDISPAAAGQTMPPLKKLKEAAGAKILLRFLLYASSGKPLSRAAIDGVASPFGIDEMTVHYYIDTHVNNFKLKSEKPPSGEKPDDLLHALNKLTATLETRIREIKLVENPVVESLKKALQNIYDLPQAVRDSFDTYFDSRYVESLGILLFAMLKMHKGVMPDQRENSILDCPEWALSEVTYGLKAVITHETLEPSMVKRIQDDILAPLEKVVTSVNKAHADFVASQKPMDENDPLTRALLDFLEHDPS